MSIPEGESSRPYLIPTPNPCEMGFDVENSELADVKNVLSIFIQSASLWFRVEYSIGGVRAGIDPSEFIEARENPKKKDEILNFKASELNEASGVLVTIINPNKHEII